MTRAQWLVHYYAAQDKEEQETKLQVEVATESLKKMRDILVGTLGLNLLPPAIKGEEDDGGPRFVPFSMLVGRPEVLKAYIDKLKVAQAQESAVADVDFELVSSEIEKHVRSGRSSLPPALAAALFGDITPKHGAYWASEAAKAQLAGLVGYGVPDGPVFPISAVPKQRFEEFPSAPAAKSANDISEDELARYRAAFSGEGES